MSIRIYELCFGLCDENEDYYYNKSNFNKIIVDNKAVANEQQKDNKIR